MVKALSNTPMAGTEDIFLEAAEKYDIDPLLMIAIGYHESRNCSVYLAQKTTWSSLNRVRTSSQTSPHEFHHNCAGIMTSYGLKKYNSFEDFIFDHFRLIRTGYLDRGLTTIASIGARYAPIGANNDPNGLNHSWVGGVSREYKELLSQLELEPNAGNLLSDKL